MVLPADDPAHLAVITSGQAATWSPSHHDRQVLLGIHGPGQLVGEDRLNGPSLTWLARVTALEPTRALLIGTDQFTDFLRSWPTANMALVQILAARLHHSEQQWLEFVRCTVTVRLARFLHRLVGDHAHLQDEELVVPLPLSQRDLAAAIGASREAVIKALRRLRNLQIIDTQRRRITILNPDHLRDHAQWWNSPC